MDQIERIRVRSPLCESSTPSTPSREPPRVGPEPSHFQEGMNRCLRNLLRDHGAQGINLFVGNRDRFSAHADDPETPLVRNTPRSSLLLGTSLTKT